MTNFQIASIILPVIQLSAILWVLHLTHKPDLFHELYYLIALGAVAAISYVASLGCLIINVVSHFRGKPLDRIVVYVSILAIIWPYFYWMSTYFRP